MDKKRYLLLGGVMVIFVLAIALTYALIYYRSDNTEVNLASDVDFGQYINYENGTPILSSANATLDAGEDYTSGLSTEIEFWKTYNAHNMVLYGHIFLDIDTGSSNLLGEPGLKWAVVSNNTVLGQGDFTSYNQGDSIPMYVNFELSSTETHFQIYVWIDQNIASRDIANESLKVTVRCEATTKEYSQAHLQRLNADVINFDYSGDIDLYYVTKSGTYKLEVWGAQGGNESPYVGGYGGYSVGTISLNTGDVLYVAVGSAGGKYDESIGYNGGGYGSIYCSNSYGSCNNEARNGGGGGATHIATRTGTLKALSNQTSSILIVAGGGGGAVSNRFNPNYSGTGGYGGGAVGGPGVPANELCYGYGLGGTQTEAGGYVKCTNGYNFGRYGTMKEGGFGMGDNYDAPYLGNYSHAGGGGGYYGGHAGYSAPGGGGSSYIGNLTDGKMYCYNCTEDINSKTYTTANASETAEANSAKIGNGYARITRMS